MAGARTQIRVTRLDGTPVGEYLLGEGVHTIGRDPSSALNFAQAALPALLCSLLAFRPFVDFDGVQKWIFKLLKALFLLSLSKPFFKNLIPTHGSWQ